MIPCNAFQNPTEQTGLDRVVQRDGFVVFAVTLRRHARMRTALPGDFVAEGCTTPGSVLRLRRRRQLHCAKTSSRTKWRRITHGPLSDSSKWQSTASRTLARNASNDSACVWMAYPSAEAIKPPSVSSSRPSKMPPFMARKLVPRRSLVTLSVARKTFP